MSVTQSTPCFDCGHRHDLHCISVPRFHWPSSEGAVGFYLCLTEHCEAQRWDGKEMHPCGCIQFRAMLTHKIKLKRPRADGWTPCARCTHPKRHHCVKGRPGFTLGDADGEPFVCSHYVPGAVVIACTDGRCAEADESGEFCDCPGFVNPFLIQEVQLELFQLREAAETGQP